jgi:hypothetical protein
MSCWGRKNGRKHANAVFLRVARALSVYQAPNEIWFNIKRCISGAQTISVTCSAVGMAEICFSVGT